MIDWWPLFFNSLWIVGLALALAAWSWADYQAHRGEARLRQKLAEPSFQKPFNVGMALFCLGLLLSGRWWWERLLWGVLAAAFALGVLRYARSASRPEGEPADRPSEASPLQTTAAAMAGAEIWVVTLLVVAGVASEDLLPWALGVAGIFWLVRWLAYGRLSVRTPADWATFLLLLLTPVTLWAAPLPEATRPAVYRLLGGIALYYAVVNWATTSARLRLLVTGVMLAGLFLALYALVSVQWSSRTLGPIPSPVPNGLSLPTSGTVNPNIMAGTLVILWPCALGCLLFGWRQLSWVHRMLAFVTVLAMIAVQVATLSRGGLAAMVAVLSGLALLRWRRGWLLLLVLGGAAAVVVQSLGIVTVLDLLASGGSLAGLGGRLEVWSRALYVIQDFPFTGIGMGSFGQVADILYPFFSARPGDITHAHNLFLQVAVDLGIPGLIAWLAIMMLVVTMAWQVYRRGRRAADGWMAGLGAGLLCSQVALVVHGLTNASTWGAIRTAPIAWTLWGLTMAAALRSSTQESPAADKSVSAEPELPPLVPVPGRSRRTRWLGWGLILAGLLVIGGWCAVTGVQVWNHARSLQGHLQYLEGFIQGDASGVGLVELESVGAHLAGMRQDLGAIQSQVGPLLPAGRLLRWVPRYGGDLAAASDLLDVATKMTSAGDQAFHALSPAFELFDDSTADPASAPSAEYRSRGDVGERLLPVLVAAQPDLQAAQGELVAVREARARIDAQTLSPRVVSLLERLDRYLPWFEAAVDGALLVPSLLGADRPRTYLVIAQNNHELRATGGFISGVGELTADRGRLSSLSFDDSYAVDNLQAPHDPTPLDFQRVLWGQLWFFRDTNWDADFPTSARRALDVYARDRGVQADGVIALDLLALRSLVGAIGPLEVEGIAESVTGRNVLQVIQQQWNEPSAGSDQDWWAHRKDFMGQIASAAMARLVSGQDLEPVGLARALKLALDQKQFLIYLADPLAANLLREQNWDGALTVPSIPSDLLLVVDSNVGFNKVDARMTRSIQYQVDLAEVGPRVRLTLNYQHGSNRPVGDCIQESHYGEAYTDMMDRCYWDYVRVYVPAGSRLVAGPNLPLPPGSLLARNSDILPAHPISPTLVEDGRAVWAVFFDLPTMEEQTLTFDYQLPAGVLVYDADGLAHYRLRVQKQPGTEAVPLRVEVTLPPGAELVSATPAGQPVWDTDLRIDREFEVVFRERKVGP